MRNQWRLELAERFEKEGAEAGEYPGDWPEIARMVKTLAGWRCERCGKAHEKDGPDGFVLTVHHLDGMKWNCELWNLASLCQRCHLKIQNKVIFYEIPKIWNWEKCTYETLDTHSEWMARHIKGYNVHAWLYGLEQIPLKKIIKRDYSKEWRK